MARNNPERAYRRYAEALQKAVGCITERRLTLIAPDGVQVGRPYSIVLNNGDPVVLRSRFGDIAFDAGQRFRIVKDDDIRDGPFRAQTIEYWYALGLDNGPSLLTFHWTPEAESGAQRRYPHLHVGSGLISGAGTGDLRSFSKLHVPTDRVSVESVIRFAIEELQVPPRRQSWDRTLETGHFSFSSYRRKGLGPRG